MAAPRTWWKGQLRLSLVSIDVALYAATDRSSSVSLRMIHEPSGKPVHYQKVAEGVGPIEGDEIVKGFDIGDRRFVILEPDELEAIKLESKSAIRLAQFVGEGEIDPRYFDRPYYVTPVGEAATEGFVVMRAALAKARKVGLGQMTMRGREYLVAVRPCGRGLLLETLRYADEVRSSDAVFADIPEVEVDPEMMELAEELNDRKSAPFEPERYTDHYREALAELIERKRAGKAVVAVGEEEGGRRAGNVVDLMDALKRSLSEEPGEGKASGAPRRGKGRASPGTATTPPSGKRSGSTGKAGSGDGRGGSRSRKAG